VAKKFLCPGRVLGVDDFAIRRGQTYSTVLTSVENHHVVDVLPTREAGPLAAWLIRHPGVEIICRDRAGAYAEGARRGDPDALQVADRFHLWQGLGRAVDTCVAAHRDCLRNPSPSGMLPEATRLAAGWLQDDLEPVGRWAERKNAAHALVHELLEAGAVSTGRLAAGIEARRQQDNPLRIIALVNEILALHGRRPITGVTVLEGGAS
jgi:hypothetical protein